VLPIRLTVERGFDVAITSKCHAPTPYNLKVSEQNLVSELDLG